jgi:hypothetical protein
MAIAALLAGPGNAQPVASYTVNDFARVPKVDAHVHANTSDPALLLQARRDGFDLLSINVDYPDFPPIDQQFKTAQILRKRDPQHFHFAATFSMEGWSSPGWADHVSARLRSQAADGAVAVKIWKNVGLAERDKSGKLIMLDDPGFDPVVRTVDELNIALIDHQGEPRNCWLPMDQMSTDNDRRYFAHHPQYYMYMHPEMPSYETLMVARDRFVARHRELNFVGAHMASLEWSVDQLAAFLNDYPNTHVDLAARMSQVQAQSAADPLKVRDFFIRYADRLLYGTDITAAPNGQPDSVARGAHAFWLSDWTYLATSQTQYIKALHRQVKGLNLPKDVIDKIYWGNAHHVFRKLGHGA